MDWNLTSDRPIYSQLIEQITLAIVSGEYRSGDKLPSVRDLAQEAAVNPNTMQKALSELEREGLVYTQRTAGRFITEDIAMIEEKKQQLALRQIEKFLTRMSGLGISHEKIIEFIQAKMEEEK